MNFVFKIFGVPHVFDIYQGNENEISYFQTFYNGSKENIKLTIHRMASGQVSYSYLRYNFISGSGRPNSFFGMSLLFTKEFCADVESLYKFFDLVYGTILQNKILLEPIEDNPTAQARYLVRSFAVVESEIRRIENIVCKNIEKEFVNDIRPLDDSFQKENPNLTRRLNEKKGNTDFLGNLRKYSWVNISPEYDDDEGLSTEVIDLIRKRISDLQGNISTVVINKEVKKISEQIQQDKICINPYLKVQPELQEIQKSLDNIQKQLNELNHAFEQRTTSNKTSNSKTTKKKSNKQQIIKQQTATDFGTTQTLSNSQILVRTGNATINDEKISEPTQPPITTAPFTSEQTTNNKAANSQVPETQIHVSRTNSKWRKFKIQLISLACIIILSVGVWWIYSHHNDGADKDKTETSGTEASEPSEPTAEEKNTELVRLGNLDLDRKSFDEAIDKFTKAGKIELVSLAKSKAIEYWNLKAAEATTPQESISYLEKTRNYGQNPDLNIAEYRKKIVNDQNKPPKSAAKQKNKISKIDKDAIVNTVINNVDSCTVTTKMNSKNRKWNVEELFNQLKKENLNETYLVIISGCNAIINQCPNYSKIEEVKKLHQEAQAEKEKQILKPGF